MELMLKGSKHGEIPIVQTKVMQAKLTHSQHKTYQPLLLNNLLINQLLLLQATDKHSPAAVAAAVAAKWRTAPSRVASGWRLSL